MIIPEKTTNEEERLKALHLLKILDTLPEKDYDNLTEIAAGICGTKVSLVSLIDENRQWFKSSYNIDVTETPRDLAFCAHAIHQPNEIMVVPDAREDERFHDNPLVTGDAKVIFYAGAPLVTDEGYALGTLCVVDDHPKNLDDAQKRSLEALSQQVVRLLELRKNRQELEVTVNQLQTKNSDLNSLITNSIDDLSSPLHKISNLSKMFLSDKTLQLNPSKQLMLKQMASSSERLKGLFNSLKRFNAAQDISQLSKQIISIDELKSWGNNRANVRMNWMSTVDSLNLYTKAIQGIFGELLSNAIRFNDHEEAIIHINLQQNDHNYLVQWMDNSQGMATQDIKKAFTLYQTLEEKDRFGERTNGIGLAIVRSYIKSMGGSISMNEDYQEGLQFDIEIPINHG